MLGSSVFVRASSADALEDLLRGTHHPGSLPHWRFTLFIDSGHSERAHVEDNGSDLWLHEELYEFWHFPCLGAFRMFVDKVAALAELYLVDLGAEPDVVLAFLQLPPHIFRISLRSANLL